MLPMPATDLPPEQYKLACEVRTITRWTKERIRSYLTLVEARRSREAYEKLRSSVLDVVGEL